MDPNFLEIYNIKKKILVTEIKYPFNFQVCISTGSLYTRHAGNLTNSAIS